MHLDEATCQVHDPVLGHPGRGIERALDPPVVLE